MIRLPPSETLAPASRHALALLVDGSRVLPSEVAGVTAVEVIPGSGEADRLDPDRDLDVADGVVRVREPALRLVTRIAGVVDEQRSGRADRFGRVPADDNFLASRGLERDPPVSRFAIALRAAAVRAAGPRPFALVAPWPGGRRWALGMSHDLDVVAFWPLFAGLRGVELAARGRLRDIVRTAAGALRWAFGSPVWSAARHVLDTEQRAGIRSSWFVIAATPTLATFRAGDATYAAESEAARRIVRAAVDASHEIGLHGSFETWIHADRFAAQRTRLEHIASSPVRGVRQHFLRMRPGTSHAAMEAAGFTYDSTCGFADRNGFRAGTADVVPAWHDAAAKTMALDVVPFVWMDRALSKYRGVENPRAWIDDALLLARVCRDVEGVWTGIWHPNLTAALGFPGADRAFEELCAALMADAPWSATLHDIVEWRRARRAARATRLDPDGAIRIAAHSPAHPIVLEDASGRALGARPA